MADATLTGRVAIVTGASAGIGAAIAETLAHAGAKVVLAARRLERIEANAKALEDSGCEALAVRTDVTSLEDMRALAEATLGRFDGIDILVNNAGVMPVSPFAEGRVDEWKLMVDVNVMGVLNGIAAVLPEQRLTRPATPRISRREPFAAGMVFHYVASLEFIYSPFFSSEASMSTATLILDAKAFEHAHKGSDSLKIIITN